MGKTGQTDIKICLFFTYGISLKIWDKLGLLDREVRLYEELSKKGVKVGFFTYGDQSDLLYKERLSSIEIIPAYGKTGKYKNRVAAFLQSFLLPFIFQKSLKKYNIFKTNQMWGAWVPLFSAFLFGKKLLVRCGYEQYYTLLAEKKTFFTRIWFYLFSKTVYFFADHIIVTAVYIIDFLILTFKVNKKKISHIFNFIDTDLFCPNGAANEINDRVIFVGRFSNQKNLFTLIDAIKKSGIGLDLVGTGELFERLKEYSADINADVRFIGTYPNNQLPALIRKYGIFILPSVYEGNPKVLLEAMSCGLAVIGTDVDGIRELISHGENGFLAAVNDSTWISELILKLNKDAVLRKHIGANARNFITKNCDLRKVTRRELSIYRYLIKS